MGIYLPNMEMPKDIEPGLVIEFADGIDGKRYARLWHYRHGGLTEWLEAVSTADVRPVPEGGIGEMSDGYHTFNGLYYQRMVLFAALVKVHKDKAWKSYRHEDGELCFGGGWFIVGIDTPQGSYTYHYEDKYWNWFECKELPVAKHWDGHTEEDVTRLLSLDVRPVIFCRDCKHSTPWYSNKLRCFLWHEDGIDVFNDDFCNYGEKREES